ncbi:MAG: sensor signal transduction histidine kinase [Ramlibacter sp.]|jgi:sigma-B regulation protein RsbU (phosphoserine phosphatase)|nr:sensor signal transduction histidine kinase [Ramlibacter sp.]MDB5911610.1 sensor signal transduction histidine kinase [Ramlibacter sp.]
MAEPPKPGAEQLYELAPCGLLLAAANGTLLQVNATLCRTLQYTADELVGKLRFQDLLTMGGRIFWQTHLQPLLRMQGSVAEVKLEVRRKDGSALPVLVNMAERPHEREPLLHAAVIVAEDRHKYERELLLQRRRAEELAAQVARDQHELAAAQAKAHDRALFAEHLVGMVSHDIRNPLSVIHMSTVLLQKGLGPEQHGAVVARVARAVARVQHLIGDLLDFTQARVGAGLSLRKVPVDLHQSVADGVAELAAAFPRTRIEHVRSGGGTCVADADRVLQAIGNLVANAVSHGAADCPVTVRSENTGEGFRITVHNHGRPIPPEVLPRLFEPMVRGADTLSQGVGLGLYIVREIVRGHGGEVQVSSTAEAGTSFVITLPCS